MTIIKTIDENTFSFELEGNNESVIKIADICEEIREFWKLRQNHIFTLNLILEELISNTIFHGFKKQNNNYIHTTLTKFDYAIVIKIRDNGIPFNPMAVNTEPKNVKLDEKQIGGLGIHLVKTLSNKVEYQNINGENNLLIEISINKNCNY